MDLPNNYTIPTLQDDFRYMNNFLNCEYSNVRVIDMNEFNRLNLYNATFLDDGKYYVSQKIANISEREVIMDLVKNEKYFGDSEKKARNKIIEEISVKHQNNFFDYYA